MAENSKELSIQEKIQITTDSIEKIDKKDFNIYFYVFDTKGNPSGSLEYLYQTALVLNKKGYKVTMLHYEDTYVDNQSKGGKGTDYFVGVEEWLGKEYAELPHKSIKNENVEIGPSDFLFVPERLVHVLVNTKNLPCERILVVENYEYLAEFMPVGVTLRDLKVNTVIATTNVQEGIVKSYFPSAKTYVVSPSINKVFRPAIEPQKLIINVVSRNQEDINQIIKPFYWKYPIYKWISFRELRGLSQDVFADALREAAITIWVDEESNFGFAALEAMRSNTILLAKLPKTLSDWNLEKTGEEYVPTDACVWFDHLDRVPDILASVIRTWTLDKVPAEVYEKQHKLDNVYTPERQETEIEKAYGDIFENRKKSFQMVLSGLKDKAEKE